MSKTKWSHFAFHILISKHILLKNKIYVKIHREKLYKLKFILIIYKDCILKKKQKFMRSIFSIVKESVFFLHERELT